MKEKKYVVYMHTAPDGRVYIGITSQKNPKKRWDRGRGYKSNFHFFRFINKYGWDCIASDILYEGLSKEEAEQKEIELIAFYDSTNPQKGFNIEKGGNLNKEISEETRKKLSESHKGIEMSTKTRNNMRQGQKESWKTGKRKQRVDYSRNTEGVSQRNKDRCSRAVYKIDMHTGQILCKYNSLSDAQKDGYNHSNISSVARGTKRSYKGFIWIKEEDYSSELLQKRLTFAHEKVSRRGINQYDTEMNFIRNFKSVRAVEREVGYTNRLAITSCCNRNIDTAFGFVWRYADETEENLCLDREYYKELQSHSDIIKYEQYDLNNVLLHQYKSLTEIRQAGYNSYFASLCCQNKKETYANSIWKYA